jgi:hypothetical protein
MPIAGEEFVFEMTANFLLPPNCKGVPRLLPSMEGEKQMAKMPDYFEALVKSGKQIDEDRGEAMAKWAAGDVPAAPAKKRDPLAGLDALVKLGNVAEAEDRILLALGKNHRSEITDADLPAIESGYKAVKHDKAAFDRLYPCVPVCSGNVGTGPEPCSKGP